MVTQYLEQAADLRFDPDLIGQVVEEPNEHHGGPTRAVTYRGPEDVFLHGLIDKRLGSCANMAALQLAIGWRLGWPVSLCCLGAHFALRWDDGQSVYTIEPSATGCGAFAVHDDATCLPRLGLPIKAVECGSDLRALTPRETLAVFIGLRARVYENTGRHAEAERDYCLARSLFPNNRYLAYAQQQLSLQRSAEYFEVNERGHPNETAAWLCQLSRHRGWPLPESDQRVGPGGPVRPRRPEKLPPFSTQIDIF